MSTDELGAIETYLREYVSSEPDLPLNEDVFVHRNGRLTDAEGTLLEGLDRTHGLLLFYLRAAPDEIRRYRDIARIFFPNEDEHNLDRGFRLTVGYHMRRVKEALEQYAPGLGEHLVLVRKEGWTWRTSNVLEIAPGFILEPLTKQIRRVDSEDSVRLTDRPYRILDVLVRNPDWSFNARELVLELEGPSHRVRRAEVDALRRNVGLLREALAALQLDQYLVNEHPEGGAGLAASYRWTGTASRL